MNHVIDVLRGSRNQKVLQHEHEKLSTHGIGKDHSVEEWRHLGRSLLHQGLVEETTDGYSILKLNAHSWQILRKERAVSIALPTQTGLASDQESRPTAEVEKLLKRLRALRKAIADEQSVAPYIIFSDISLRQMAERQPQTPDEFSRISGVGSFKLEQYGDRFIGEIREFCGEHDIPLRSGSTAISSAPRPRSVSRTLLQTLELHEQGLAPAAIAEQRGCTLSTVYDHLEKLLLVGKPVDIDELVPEDRQAKIVTAIETVGTASLRTLYDYLEEAFDYEEIRLVRAYWRNEKSSDS
jgi:ATP-dependent DNA helicase RecQ